MPGLRSARDSSRLNHELKLAVTCLDSRTNAPRTGKVLIELRGGWDIITGGDFRPFLCDYLSLI